MQKAKLIMFIVLFMLLFGGVIMLMFSCKPLKPNGITIIPETANVDSEVMELMNGKVNTMRP